MAEQGWDEAAKLGKDFILEAVGSPADFQTGFSKLFLSTVWNTDWKVEGDWRQCVQKRHQIWKPGLGGPGPEDRPRYTSP